MFAIPAVEGRRIGTSCSVLVSFVDTAPSATRMVPHDYAITLVAEFVLAPRGNITLHPIAAICISWTGGISKEASES